MAAGPAQQEEVRWGPASHQLAMIFGRNSGSCSQVLLGLLASLKQPCAWAQPQHPLCRLIWDSAGEEERGLCVCSLSPGHPL
jgi:hypothetical protein